jgi:hypothetical protein
MCCTPAQCAGAGHVGNLLAVPGGLVHEYRR